MASRPRFVDSTEKPRALLAAFAEVPGPTAAGVRAEQLLLGFSEDVEFDALTLKGAALTHIQRVGAARMMRVPLPDAARGDDVAAFRERLATFRRALVRQLEGDRYDLILCLDLFAAATAAPLLRDARLVVDVADIPSLSFATRWPVDPGDEGTRRSWEADEKIALRAARLLLVPSRVGGRVLSERADPRLLRAAPRLVDTRWFVPPTMELSLDGERTIVVFGGREARRTPPTVELLERLVRRNPDARLLWVGHPGRGSTAGSDGLPRSGLGGRVVVVDVNSPAELTQVLHTADVVVVPAGGGGVSWGVPHRALEAMACERAVVVGGSPATYKDAVADGVHARVIDGGADDLAVAVRGLLDDDTARRTIARAGRKQALGFDLGARLPEVSQLVQETTGVRFTARLAPLPVNGDPERPSAVERPRRPAGVIVAVPPAAVAAEYSDGAAAPPERRAARAPPTAQPPSSVATVRPARPSNVAADPPVPGPAPLSSPIAIPRTDHVRPSEPTSSAAGDGIQPGLPKAGAARVPGRAAVVAEPDAANTGGWVGDTVLDSGSGPVIAADRSRIKAALLQTTSGDAVPPAGSPTVEASMAQQRPTATDAPRSVSVVIDSLDGDDDWSRDTVADASPIEASTPVPTRERSAPLAPPRSMIFDVVSELTAEDREPEH